MDTTMIPRELDILRKLNIPPKLDVEKFRQSYHDSGSASDSSKPTRIFFFDRSPKSDLLPLFRDPFFPDVTLETLIRLVNDKRNLVYVFKTTPNGGFYLKHIDSEHAVYLIKANGSSSDDSGGLNIAENTMIQTTTITTTTVIRTMTTASSTKATTTTTSSSATTIEPPTATNTISIPTDLDTIMQELMQLLDLLDLILKFVCVIGDAHTADAVFTAIFRLIDNKTSQIFAISVGNNNVPTSADWNVKTPDEIGIVLQSLVSGQSSVIGHTRKTPKREF